MEEKIEYEQVENLIVLCYEKKILLEWIKGICRVDKISDLTVKQYNFLLALIKNI